MRDVTSGTVVFLVALPLCLGIAVASGAPPFAGILTGIVGGILAGMISGSHTSVSGPAAGLTAIVAAQIAQLGSFEAFLMAVTLAGVCQIALSIARAGVIASYFPSSVIKGLLAAIGVILIVKQLPYVIGHEAIGENVFEEMAKESGGHEHRGHENPLASLLDLFSGVYHPGPLIIGLLSLALLTVWDMIKPLKKSLVPAPLIVVLLGVLLASLFEGTGLKVESRQLVRVPVAQNIAEFIGFFRTPDWQALAAPAVYIAGLTIAIVATLESMLNLEAVDNLDPRQRMSPPNRELLAQGVGNITAGLIGGLPMTCVVVRGSVNINAGARTKLSTILHGCLLLAFALWFPHLLNRIPLASLAAILLVTGLKLASPKLIAALYREGYVVFLPFAVTVIAIVWTDLLIGILIGLGVSLFFILAANSKRPAHTTIIESAQGPVHHIELAQQVSYLSRSILEKSLRETPKGGHVLLDARETDFIDPDILSFLHEFRAKTAPALGIQVSVKNFKPQWRLPDEVLFDDSTTGEVQDRLTPASVLRLLLDGHRRCQENRCLPRDMRRQIAATGRTQFPTSLVITCMDSRMAPELIFDARLGDLMSIRLGGGTFLDEHSLASVEYACSTVGVRLIMVLGQFHSPVFDAALHASLRPDKRHKHGDHFHYLVNQIVDSLDDAARARIMNFSGEGYWMCVDELAQQHVIRTVDELLSQSETLRAKVERSEIGIVAAMYDPRTGQLTTVKEMVVGSEKMLV